MRFTFKLEIFEDEMFFTARYMSGCARAAAELTNMGDYWYFNRLIVAEKLRHQGIGTALVKSVVDWAVSKGYNILCQVNAYGDLNAEQLNNFYMKHGFKPLFPDSVEKGLYFGGIEKLPMDLILCEGDAGEI